MKSNSNNKFISLTKFLLSAVPYNESKLFFLLLFSLFELVILIYFPLISAKIIDSLTSKNWEIFKSQVIVFFILIITQAIIGFINRYFRLWIIEKGGMGLRNYLINEVIYRELNFFEKHWVGDIISRVINDSSALKTFLTDVFLQLIVDGISLLIVIVILINMNPVLALLTICTAPMTFFLGKFTRPKLEKMALRIRENIAELTGQIQSWLTRSFGMKLYALEQVVSKSFFLKNMTLTKNTIKYGLFGVLIGASSMTLISIPTFIILTYGGYLTFEGKVTLGELVAFMTFASYFNGPIQRIVEIWLSTLPSMYAIYLRIQEFVSNHYRNLPESHAINDITGIEIADMSFKYDSSNYELIIPSLILQKGKVTTIVGANGTGKSTLARIICGLDQPSSGKVFALKNEERLIVSSNTLKNYVAVLPQQPILFEGSLIENLTLFDSNPNYERVNAIIEELKLNSLITTLPSGLNDHINPGLAKTFSLGQMKKIELARAMYRDRPIMIFDEPESGLDELSKLVFKEILYRLSKNKIIIYITHEYLIHADDTYRISPVASKSGYYECIKEFMNGEEK